LKEDPKQVSYGEGKPVTGSIGNYEGGGISAEKRNGAGYPSSPFFWRISKMKKKKLAQIGVEGITGSGERQSKLAI